MEVLQRKFPRQKFSNLVDIKFVSCKTGEHIQELRSTISQVVMQKGFLPQVSESWVKLHDFIQSLSGENETISRSILEDWARMCGVRDEQIPMALEFLRDMGTIMTFEGEALANLVVLDPAWLSNIMASLITFRHTWIKEGILQMKDVPQVFREHAPAIHDTLLALLEQFSIIYRMQSNSQRCILVPSLLPEEYPTHMLAKEWSYRPDTVNEYGRLYRFPSLPVGFFGRFMVRVLHSRNVTDRLKWRNGMVIEYTPHATPLDGPQAPRRGHMSSHRALLEYDPVNFQFSVRVRTPQSQSRENMLLQMLIDGVDTILEEYGMREAAERLIPCTHCINAASSQPGGGRGSTSNLRNLNKDGQAPFLFSFAECVIAVTEHEGHVFCNHIRSPSRMVSVDQLAPDIALSGIPLIDEKQLKIGAVLGRGGFGVVYRAQFQPLTTAGRYQLEQNTPTSRRRNRPSRRTRDAAQVQEVAVKELQCAESVEMGMLFTDFQQEVFLMSQLRHHPNIVRLHGVCLFPRPRMVLEFLSHGDLFRYLHPTDEGNPENLQTFIHPPSFPWKLRLLMALDIAKGMFVMHDHTPAIIHRDLRSPNIFISSLSEGASARVKVADFGLARMVAPSVSGALNTWQWVAPEVLGMAGGGKPKYGTASDVYSFAICCWELATGGFPFDEYNEVDSGNRVKDQAVTDLKNRIATQNLRPSLLPSTDEAPVPGVNCPTAFNELIEDCWQSNPNDRPSFREILQRFKKILPLSSKQVSSVDQLLGQPTYPETGINRASTRVSIDFRPLEITSVIRKRAATVRYHTEYKKVAQYQVQSSTITPSCAEIVDSGNHSVIWVGFKNGNIFTWTLTDNNNVDRNFVACDKTPISFLIATDRGTIWSISSGGKVMVWDIEVGTAYSLFLSSSRVTDLEGTSRLYKW